MVRKRFTGWGGRAIAIATIVIVIIAVDAWTGEYIVPATARLLWGTLSKSAMFVARFVIIRTPTLPWVFLRRNALKSLAGLLIVPIGYCVRIFVSDDNADKTTRRLKRLITHGVNVRAWWKARPAWVKVALVAALVGLQVELLPELNEYIILFFPIGFLIPTIERLYRRIFGKTQDPRAAQTGWRSAIQNTAYLLRLRYLTAWRLREYGGRRMRDLILEIVCLWKTTELDRYRTRPLFAGIKGRPPMA